MDFDLTQEQKAIRDSVAEMLFDQCPADRAMAIFNSGTMDAELWKKTAQMDIAGIMVADLDGGSGLDLLTLAVIAEELGFAGASTPIISVALSAWLIGIAGNSRQKARWLEPLNTGTLISTFAFAEYHNGWMKDSWQLDGNILSGKKYNVEHGDNADLFIVGLSGGKLAIVEAAAAGVEVIAIDSVDRSRPLFELSFDAVPVDLIEASDNVVDQLLDAQLILLAADAMGSATRALKMAVEYAKERKQFDQVIGSFQALKHQLADMEAVLQPCRPLYWYAAHAWDQLPEQRRYAAAVAKAHISDVAHRVARGTVEIHGGIGYTWEYPLHLWLKRTMFDRAAMGLPAYHRNRIAQLSGW